MSQKNRSKRSKRLLWVILLVLILSGAGGYAYYQFVYLPAQNTGTEQAALQTATARIGSLTLSASGTGTLITASETVFGFETSGTVTVLYVKPGDVVEAGQVLAELDPVDAQAQYDSAKSAWLELTSPLSIATAKQSVISAKEAMNSAKYYYSYLISPDVFYWQYKVQEAEQALSVAQAAAATDSSAEAQQKVAEAEKTLRTMNAYLATAKTTCETTYVPDEFTVMETTTDPRTGVTTTEIVYITDEETGEEIPLIEAPSDDDIEVARINYELALARYNEATYYLAALKGEELPENATGSQLAKVIQAEEDVATALEAIHSTALLAPISGTILSVGFDVGTKISTNANINSITIADLSQPELVFYMDESDWVNVKVGYDVEVTFDAIEDTIFAGKVIQVDPTLFSQGMTSMVRGYAQLDPIDPDTQLLIGMSGAVDVISNRAENVVLVPIEALREISEGKYAVFVMEDGEPVLRMVEVGIQDLYYAEIKSGLEAGETVTTGIVETNQ